MAMRSTVETIKGAGEELVAEVERLIHEGNVRRVVVKHGDETVAEFPLTFGVVGALVAPMLVALGALVGALSHCTVEIERHETPPAETGTRTSGPGIAPPSDTTSGSPTDD
jgi:hypothetical protein